MKNVIENIRKQPEEIRRHILHLFTVIFAVILIFLWVYSLGSSFTSVTSQAGISQDLKPFSALKDNMENGYNDLSQPSSSTTDSNSTNGTANDNSNSGQIIYERKKIVYKIFI